MANPKFPFKLKRKQVFILAIIGCAVLFFIVRPLAHWVVAQQAAQAIEVSPPTQEISSDPGKTVKVKAKVRNGSNTTQTMTVNIEGFIASGDEGQVALTNDNPYSVANWTTIEPKEFTLEPGKSQEVTATVTIPRDAAGGRYGSFLFGIKPGEGLKGAASVSQQVASLFLIKVNGTTKETLNLKSFTSPQFLEFGPIPFGVTYENTGNVHVKAYGVINVTDMFGKTTEDVVVRAYNVFPGANRTVSVATKKKMLIGKYTATALIYYGSNNEVLTATTTFIVFPVRIAVIVLVILVILFMMRKRFKKAFKALGGK